MDNPKKKNTIWKAIPWFAATIALFVIPFFFFMKIPIVVVGLCFFVGIVCALGGIYNLPDKDESKQKAIDPKQEEIKKNRIGRLLLLAVVPLIALGVLLFNSQRVVGYVLMGLSIWCAIIGFFMAIQNRSASKIAEDTAMAQAVVSYWGTKVKAGQSLTEKDVDKAISAMGMDGVQKLEEKKRIIAGAVAGGIIAGDVGAVAGAVATKAKIEEEKLNK